MQASLHTRVDDAHWTTQILFETDVPYLRNAEPPRRFTL
jgi:protein-L-isoaspartate(D-aspartate) O-methyltransferase